MTKRTILLIEDETAISEPLAAALQREGFDPVVAGTVAEGLELFEKRSPDLVLLDVMLPDGDGRDVLRTIRETSRTPVVMLTARGEEMDRVLGLELGADDYITKPFSIREFMSRVRALLRRAQLPPAGARDEVIEVDSVRIDTARRSVEVDGTQAQLTYLEFELLRTLATNPGRVFTRKALLDQLWGGSEFRDPRTIDVHVRHLREKIERDPSEPEFIFTVRGAGYRFRETR
jgi:DNA-binding response OmpR family regulator